MLAAAIILGCAVLVEEEHLEDVYGDEYLSYKQRAPRNILFL